jgi:hypothetical protein
MTTRKSRTVPALVAGVVAFFLVGCQSAQQTTPAEAAAPPAAPAAVPETQQVAEAVLGKQAEVVARGDLAGNGSEQLLVVNRFEFEKGARGDVVRGNSTTIFLTRAVIVEKDDGKWAEVLRCDEHLKNPRGYLGGSPAAPVTGWRLEFTPHTGHGIELRFTPSAAGEQRPSDEPDRGGRTIAVRWNARAKRYQSLDQSHKGYLGEVPTLETPQSILR